MTSENKTMRGPRKSNHRNTPRGHSNPPRREYAPVNCQKSFDKYIHLAKDAVSSGDEVSAENYYQHAEHYYRIMHMNNFSEVES